ncbi:MAG: hypothetical protein HY331_08720, partial [Chloroflexi bacterium]|nr:hypothetical protein [Chloroflexota bacterium]
VGGQGSGVKVQGRGENVPPRSDPGSGRRGESEEASSPLSGRGAGGEGTLLPSPAPGRGAGGEGRFLPQLGALATDLAAIYAVALGVAGWWFIRNAMVYGGLDLLGWQRHAAVVVGQPRTELGLAAVEHFAVLTFQSFWAQLGWMAVPAQPNAYRALLAISVVAVLGLLAFLINPAPLDRRQWAGLALLGLALAIVFAQMAQYNLQFIQPQGRYLFPAIVPIAVFWSLGIAQVLRAPALRPVAVVLILVAALFGIWQVRQIAPVGITAVVGGAIGLLALASLAAVLGRMAWRWAPPPLLAGAFAVFDLAAIVQLIAFLG